MQPPNAPPPPDLSTERRSPLYIAPFEGEFACDVTVLFDENGHVYFADERPGDRDVDGLLWERWGGTPIGTLDWAAHHPGRQCEVMDGQPLCGVCKGDPDRDERGTLWLLNADEHTQKILTFPSNITTATPAVCVSCAWRALRACRELQRGFIAVRVREAPVVGVRGTLYSPTEPPLPNQVVRFGDDALHRLVARQLMRELLNAELDETTLAAADFPAAGPAGAVLSGPRPVWG
ncbi:hypothetical protein ACIPJN_29485 [Streptomyces sp. NPDC086796]|uniref:hypothetical protein n=1 Tax=Streptomyces sp. NPDC086796 TaxID=3365760 RepID=UPI003814C305